MRFDRTILCLSHEDVLNCGAMNMELAIKEIEQGFQAFAQGNVLQPQKTTLKFTRKGSEGNTGLVNFLPAYAQINGTEIYSCKSLGAMPSNVEKGLPRAVGLITLFDSETKAPICIMDGQVISAIRTGAVSALAARKLASQHTDSIGMLGAGVNMRTQLLGISKELKNLKTVFVYSRHETKYDFTEKMSKLTGLEIIPVRTAEEAVRGKDFFVTCLPNGVEPIVKNEWVMDSGVTAFNIGGHEMETSLLPRMDRIVADIWGHAKIRASQTHAKAFFENLINEDVIEDLTPIIVGHKNGRTDKKQNIFFCPTGLGFADAIIAWRIYQIALQNKVGQDFKQWQDCRWI